MMIRAEIPEGRERLNPYPTLRFRLQNDSTFKWAATSARVTVQRDLIFLDHRNRESDVIVKERESVVSGSFVYRNM